jgi:thioesterase superfamily protein 4
MVVSEPQNISQKPVPEEVRAAFVAASAPAWCLQALRDPDLVPIAMPSREPKASTEDSFVAETLRTSSTISAWQSFYRELQPQLGRSSVENPNVSHDTPVIKGELVNILALGKGLSGHANVAHGGLVSAVLDETMGMAVGFHQSPGMSGYTAFLNVTFKKPLPTPSVILCRTWLERCSGRKLWVRGRIEDGEGGLFAEAEGLWVEVVKRDQKL